MNAGLQFVDASREEHFEAMSLIHALGWRDTYPGYVPDEYMKREITDLRWVSVFRQNHEEGIYHGLLLYDGGTPLSCINYGPARTEYVSGSYEGWGEITSFYTHPAHRGAGYGGLLLEEACRRLKESGFRQALVLVLRENEKARKFYASHGFDWNGAQQDIPFPPDAVCVDLHYTKIL